MKKFKHNRDEQRRNQQEVKKYLDYALKRTGNKTRPMVLLENTADGMKIIDGKDKIHTAERRFTETHNMGKYREIWYIKNGVLFEGFQDSKNGKEWRQQIQLGTATVEDIEKIPEVLRPVFHEAKVCKNNNGETMNGEMYGDLFTAPIKLEELQKYIKRTKKNSTREKWDPNRSHSSAT